MKKAVQFTIDEELLRRVDADREVLATGRSAFLRRAIEEYLRRRRDLDVREAYRRGYGEQPPSDDELGVAAEVLAWPDE